MRGVYKSRPLSCMSTNPSLRTSFVYVTWLREELSVLALCFAFIYEMRVFDPFPPAYVHESMARTSIMSVTRLHEELSVPALCLHFVPCTAGGE